MIRGAHLSSPRADRHAADLVPLRQRARGAQPAQDKS
jgi:hypothetical protein